MSANASTVPIELMPGRVDTPSFRDHAVLATQTAVMLRLITWSGNDDKNI